MQYLSRAQIRRCRSGIDITVKSGSPEVKSFELAPTWNMVMGYKNGTMSETRYTELYLAGLDRHREEIHQWTLELGQDITFLCYCRDEWFCHTYILINWLVDNWPEEFCK